MEQQKQIVEFETGLSTAQAVDNNAGLLNTLQAKGGPLLLSQQDFFVGINDPLGLNPTGVAFDPVVMTEYAAWSGSKARSTGAFTVTDFCTAGSAVVLTSPPFRLLP